MQINNALSFALNGFQVRHKPSLPPQSTPAPERNKVVSKTPREPVNKQAALLIAPVRSWVFQPPPMPPEKLLTPADREVLRLVAELKAERNDHATTRDELGQARQALKISSARVKALSEEIFRLKQILRDREGLIRQLEDLKL